MTTLIAQASVRALTPVVLALSAFLLLRGHNSPGGGFPAGLLAGLWITLRQYVFGRAAVQRVVGAGAGHLVGVGLLTALATGVAALVAGRSFLEVLHWEPQLPLVGRLELSTALLFETGVALTVVGLVVAVVQELGEG